MGRKVLDHTGLGTSKTNIIIVLGTAKYQARHLNQ